MKLNCRPGDLARIVHPDMYGKLVQVHQLIATLDHRHPDGERALYSCLGCWEIESLGAPFPVKRFRRGELYQARSKWASCDDKWLRPIRNPDEDAVDEMLQRVGKPESAAIEWALGVSDVTPL